MPDNFVGYSKAGDAFHYRWAARRCLGMVYPNSSLKLLFVEGSKLVNAPGEYVIDVSEYHRRDGLADEVRYFQLKHTTVQADTPFELSDLKGTFEGFGARFADHKKKNEIDEKAVSFTIVTNRKFSDKVRTNIACVALGQKADTKFTNTLKGYTKLDDAQLAKFCERLTIEDSEGDYAVQKEELRVEISRLLAVTTNYTEMELLVAMVSDRVLPKANNKIVREDVLERLGVTSERDLYPAQAIWEVPVKTVSRDQYQVLTRAIHAASSSVIVHAPGGVGKSVFATTFIGSLPEGSVAIAYDCFGAGKYRNTSESRHRHRDALVQIANELAAQGLCQPLIAQEHASAKTITLAFLNRISQAVYTVKAAYPDGTVTIVIDAADNAEMAAKEFSEGSFARELLREEMPEGSKLVFLCRTERIDLLQPKSTVLQLPLDPFSEQETFENLCNFFPFATASQAKEFHRLTGGNPRVQANALDIQAATVSEFLEKLGPMPVGVEDQIQSLLDRAIGRIKDQLPEGYHSQVDAICLGLANLSPTIPIDILARAADVSVATVQSFVADIGRSLWVSDTSVQFRDEPTEFWFRNKFSASDAQFQRYIACLEPLAGTSTYVAEALPALYIQGKQYDKLVTIALSDNYLPANNPIDARNVRISRLQFAFKASLKLNNLENAVKLAIRAGEEVAGHDRQFGLLKSNIGLLVQLNTRTKVQNLALRRVLKGAWNGSENIYSASLLSAIDEFKGEAMGFLRASRNWLSIYFEEMRKNKDLYSHEKLSDEDIEELAHAYLNLEGPEMCIRFLNSINPKSLLYGNLKRLTRRLIDEEDYSRIEQLLSYSKKIPYFVIAIVCELNRIGRFPNPPAIRTALNQLARKKTRIAKPDDFDGKYILSDLLSFLESCVYAGLSAEKILSIVRHYFPVQASRMVYDSHFSESRDIYLRALAIRTHFSQEDELVMEKLMPIEGKNGKRDYQDGQHAKELEQIIKGLFPWYDLRLKVLASRGVIDADVIQSVDLISKKELSGRYRMHDPLPDEAAGVCLSILVYSTQASPEQAQALYVSFIKGKDKLTVAAWIQALRASCRASHLEGIRNDIEEHCRALILDKKESGPDEISGWYVGLAKAVLCRSKEDASVYFDEAIAIVSKFGDEITQRWEATAALADRAWQSGADLEELAYRFIKVAEVVGDHAREKHWSRATAIMICSRMHAGGGLAALSRWRDRDIGRYEWLHFNLFADLSRQGRITGLEAWSMAPFCSVEQLDHFFAALVKQPSIGTEDKQRIVADLVKRLEKEHVGSKLWKKLAGTAESNGVTNDKLNLLAGQNNSAHEAEDSESSVYADPIPEVPWAEIFLGVDLLTYEGLKQSQARLNEHSASTNRHYPRAVFWRGVQTQLAEKDFYRYVDTVISADFVEHYDVMEIFRLIPPEWLRKVSFKGWYEKILKQIGSRFAHELTNFYSFDNIIKGLPDDQAKVSHLSEGVFTGLSDGQEFADAEMFFGFVKMASGHLPAERAIDLLNYAVSRIEIHIDPDYGDGPWSPWLKTKDDARANMAGYLWSALGAPDSATRWMAAHSVVKLARFGCSEVLDSLVEWLESGETGAFGHHRFPFYNLHARQYLLIALTRISAEFPGVIRHHAAIITNYVFSSQHAIIQELAKTTLLALEKAVPQTVDAETLTKLRTIGVSRFDIQRQNYNYRTNTVWHERNELTKSNFRFGWDFDRYWFEPLGRVFGVSGEQVEDIAADVVVNQWKIETNGYNSDPRSIIWSRSSREDGTHHSHGGYPKTDNLAFYHSYHSMMVAAAKLLDAMPVVSTDDWTEDPWEEWLSEHTLTRKDGFWLADAKDDLPVPRPGWINEDTTDDWQAGLDPDSFIDRLVNSENGDKWLTVRGWWHERHDPKTESFYVTSALVSQEGAKSLMNALTTTKDPHDFKLPSYKEDDMEIDSPPFVLKGWLSDRSITKGIDSHDPSAEHLTYPPYSVGESVADGLELFLSGDLKNYYLPGATKPSIVTSLWASPAESRKEEPAQSGMIMRCTLDFVRHLCRELNCELIIEVRGERQVSRRYREEDYKRPAEQHKLFILSADGQLKDTTRNYPLG